VNRGGMRRGRGRGGTSGSGFNRQPGSGQQLTGTGGKPKSTLKFENDFDFEQANKEFDTLRSQLAKTKIGKTLGLYDYNVAVCKICVVRSVWFIILGGKCSAILGVLVVERF